MNIDLVEEKLLLKVIAGSRAYGLHNENSDTDIRGIFLMPNETLLGKGYVNQVSDKTNDIVHYELNRFVQLLEQGNPNIIEILNTPKDKVIYYNDIINPLLENKDKFLSKRLRNTFGGYAISQIKKARGLNKKIVNPMEKERKNPLHFCYILTVLGAVPFYDWLSRQKGSAMWQSSYGAVNVDHARNMYYIYYDKSGENGYRGLINEEETSNELRLSSIPKEQIINNIPMYYNKDGYMSYVKEYKQYWKWVEERNPHRYKDNIENEHGYDGKNLMHCFRLLDMAIEVAEGRGVNLLRPNRDFLLDVRKGKFEYDELIELAEEKVVDLDKAFKISDLPDHPDSDMVHDLLIEIRKSKI